MPTHTKARRRTALYLACLAFALLLLLLAPAVALADDDSSSSSSTADSSSSTADSSSTGSSSSSSSSTSDSSSSSSSSSSTADSSSSSSSSSDDVSSSSSSSGASSSSSSSSGASSSSSSSSSSTAAAVATTAAVVWNATIYNTTQAIGVQNIPFSMVCTSAPWTARYGHTVAFMTSTLILMGGISWWNATDTANALTDIWSSTDVGATWSLVTSSATYGIRQGATSVLVSDAVLLIGGNTLTGSTVGDVWKTADLGVTWTEVSSGAFTARSFHTTTDDVTTNILVLATGLDTSGTALNDVYMSDDSGATWTTMNRAAPFAARYGASSFWLHGVVYIIGGTTITDGVYAQANDIWKSSNSGETWSAVVSSLPSTVGRSFFASASFADKIYILAGSAGPGYVQSTSTDVIYGDVWMSADAGETWAWQESTASFGARGGVASVLTGVSLILVGGVARGAVFGDVFVASLPTGSPNADGGVVAGILGVSAGLVIFVLAMHRLWEHLSSQAHRRRQKAVLELAEAEAADKGEHMPLRDQDDDHH